jgi:O-antigen ligase
MFFLFIPLMFLAMNPMLYDAGTIFRATFVAVIPAIYSLIAPPKLHNYKPILVATTVIIFWYLLGLVVNNQSYADFLFGAYGRGFGFLSLVGLFLLMFNSADNVIKNSKLLFFALYLTLSLAIVYGIFQSFDLDFFDYKANYTGIRLTLTNPNFSSAFLGILSVVPFGMFISGGKKYKAINLALFAITAILIFQTDSTQGFILSIIGCLLIVIFRYLPSYLYKPGYIIGALISLLSLFISFIFILLNLKIFSRLTSYLDLNLGITGRLQHWFTGIKIWGDHPFFGVGIENLGKYSGEYLSDNFLAEGYLNPDKTHNLVIDHFANGGIVVGILWIFLVATITWFSIRIQESKIDSIDNAKKQILASIWITYMLQTFISTDHLVLAVLGMIAAGAIIRINLEKNKKP